MKRHPQLKWESRILGACSPSSNPFTFSPTNRPRYSPSHRFVSTTKPDIQCQRSPRFKNSTNIYIHDKRGKKSMSGFSVFCPSNKRRPAPSSRAWSCQGDEIEPDGMEVFPKSQVTVARFLSGCCFMQLGLFFPPPLVTCWSLTSLTLASFIVGCTLSSHDVGFPSDVFFLFLVANKCE